MDSLLALEELRIFYRKFNVSHYIQLICILLTLFQEETGGLLYWTNIIPTMNTKQLKDNRFAFTLHSLSPDKEYEVIIQTRNK